MLVAIPICWLNKLKQWILAFLMLKCLCYLLITLLFLSSVGVDMHSPKEFWCDRVIRYREGTLPSHRIQGEVGDRIYERRTPRRSNVLDVKWIDWFINWLIDWCKRNPKKSPLQSWAKNLWKYLYLLKRSIWQWILGEKSRKAQSEFIFFLVAWSNNPST